MTQVRDKYDDAEDALNRLAEIFGWGDAAKLSWETSSGRTRQFGDGEYYACYSYDTYSDDFDKAHLLFQYATPSGLSERAAEYVPVDRDVADILEIPEETRRMCGCITQVKSGLWPAYTLELTQMIRDNPNVPKDPGDVTRESIAVFKDLQRHMDRTIRTRKELV